MKITLIGFGIIDARLFNDNQQKKYKSTTRTDKSDGEYGFEQLPTPSLMFRLSAKKLFSEFTAHF